MPILRIALAAALIAAQISPVVAQETWDGLALSKGGRSGKVYLLPGADFRSYSKVMLEPTEVALRKDWQRDQPVGNRVGSGRVRRILDNVSAMFGKELAAALQKRGYTIVQEPGDDVLRLRSAIVNLYFVVPPRTGISRTYTVEAGQATLVLEARDSISGALLGRAIDAQAAGADFRPYLTSDVTIRTDFERVFEDWSKRTANGLDRLRASSDVGAQGDTGQ